MRRIVDGEDDRAVPEEAERAVRGLDEGGRVGQRDRDEVVVLHPELLERSGEPVRATIELLPRQCDVAAREGRLVRPLGGMPGDDPRDRLQCHGKEAR